MLSKVYAFIGTDLGSGSLNLDVSFYNSGFIYHLLGKKKQLHPKHIK